METGQVLRLDPGLLSWKTPLSISLCGPWLCLLEDYARFVILRANIGSEPGELCPLH